MFGPVVVDGAKSLINRFIAPDEMKPATVAEYVQMRQQDIEFFKALNSAGGSNPTYLWVEAVKQLMRPGAALIMFATWAYLHISLGSVASTPETINVDNMVAAVGFYLFGDRTLFYSKKALQRK